MRLVYIGTNVNGTASLGNTERGIGMNEGGRGLATTQNTINNNLISGNGTSGMNLYGPDTMSNTVSGNYIGTNATGMSVLGNGGSGIWMGNGANNNLIGGSNTTPGGACTGECNLISGNGIDGVQIQNSDNNTVTGNYIGTDVTGNQPLGNTRHGVNLSGGSANNRIGGTTAAERNLISGNGEEGVDIETEAAFNSIIGNYIGTDVSGTAVISNGDAGIGIQDAPDNELGGSQPGAGNLVFGNNDDQIEIEGAAAVRNQVIGNRILQGPGGGVYFKEDASHNLVMQNEITQNSNGVSVNGANTLFNTISQNSIYNNNGPGIELFNSGNTELTAPVITDVIENSGIISGTACAGCTIEIFSDNEDEGRVYEGNATADANGFWSLDKDSSFTGPNLTATATDQQGNTSEFSTCSTTSPIFLPIILKNFDPSAIPAAPTLNSILNPDNNGDYSVSWDTMSGATGYTLQEDDNTAFAGPTIVYAGSGTSASITGRAADTYYYRVRATKGSYASSWSNIQAVTVSSPTGPEIGHYSGSPSVSFDVSAGPEVCNYDITVPFNGGTCQLQLFWCTPVINNVFTFTNQTSTIYNISGTFDTPVHVSGDYSVLTCGGGVGISTGTWGASKQ